MKKSLIFLVVCVVLGLWYFHPDFSWLTEASDADPDNFGDMNQPLPPAAMPQVGGDWVNMQSFSGKVVLISFWTTWCPGCRDEMPDLIKLQNEFGSRGFTVVAITVDDEGEEPVDTFVQSEKFLVDGASVPVNFPVLRGTDEVIRSMGFEGGLPASVLVARDGREVKIIRGPFKEADVEKAVKRLL
jgi:thiol-disulfide isomerase/thioredoxin